MLGEMFAVDLSAKTCSCKKWALCGIPCVMQLVQLHAKGKKLKIMFQVLSYPYYCKGL